MTNPKPYERNYTDAQRAEMKVRKDAGELLPGHKKKTPSHWKSKVTDRDIYLMKYLADYKYASTDQIAILLGVQYGTAGERLRGLRDSPKMHFVDSVKVTEDSTLWFLSQPGINLLTKYGIVSSDDLVAVRKDRFSVENIGHTLAVNQIAAYLLSKRGLIKGVGQLKLDNLITEATIQREYGIVNKRTSAAMNLGAGVAGERLKRAVVNAINADEIEWEDAVRDNPALWSLTHSRTDPSIAVELKFPDLVIDLEDGRDSATPRSIAIEVELNDKSKDRYEKIMRTYAADKFVYGRVVWVIQGNREALARKIMRASRAAGFPVDRLTFIQLPDADGKPFTDFAWKL